MTTTTGRKIFILANNLILLCVALTMVLPLLNVLAVSFTTDLESYETTIKLFPRVFSLDGYRTLFQRVAILRPLINNMIVTMGGDFSACPILRHGRVCAGQIELTWQGSFDDVCDYPDDDPL